MNYHRNTTQTPNVFIDQVMRTISPSMRSVYLVILRRTVGMASKTIPNQRVQRAWISQRLFMLITGLSNKSVSDAIAALVKRNLIMVTNEKGDILYSSQSRKGVNRLYFSCNLLQENKMK